MRDGMRVEWEWRQTEPLLLLLLLLLPFSPLLSLSLLLLLLSPSLLHDQNAMERLKVEWGANSMLRMGRGMVWEWKTMRWLVMRRRKRNQDGKTAVMRS
jgi:hypothetical protein